MSKFSPLGSCQLTNATAEIVTAISLNITIPRRGYYAFPVERSYPLR